jgi:hypothetical protein
MPSKSCCRSCPRCNDCPVLVAARARAARREEHADLVSALVEDVFAGGRFARTLPDSVTRTLESLDAARRGAAAPATA